MPCQPTCGKKNLAPNSSKSSRPAEQPVGKGKIPQQVWVVESLPRTERQPVAGWYKQHTSELASLEAFAKCGRIDLVTSWLRVTRWTVDHESDELPDSLRHEAETLEEAGLVVTFASRCKKLLDQRTSMAEKREAKRALVNSCELTSIHIDSRELTSYHVNSCDHQDKTRQDKREEEGEGEHERDVAPQPASPARSKKPSKGKLALDAWCEAVKTESGTRSAEQGKTLEAIASKLQDIAAESGDTFIDIVRRRVALNKSLQIRWAAQDYATDKTQKPWKRANPLDCGNSDKWDKFEKDWKNPYGETM